MANMGMKCIFYPPTDIPFPMNNGLAKSVRNVYSHSMHSLWTPRPISEGTIPTLRQPVQVVTWKGTKGYANSYANATYLAKPDGSYLFTTGGDAIQKKVANSVGRKYGLQKIVCSPAVTNGIDLLPYAVKLADLWGLNEFGWYAAVHYDTPHPHIHFAAETEAQDGSPVLIDDGALYTWKLHAQRLSTQILGLYHA